MSFVLVNKEKELLDGSVLGKRDVERIQKTFSSFFDAVQTASGRATHYNTREEQAAALDKVHSDLFAVDRSLYGMALMLPGTMDISRMKGVEKLLSCPWHDGTFLSLEQEKKLLIILIEEIPAHRVIKLFGHLRGKKVNNKRSRQLILRTLLENSKLEYWAVKYRKKMAYALRHAWGQKKSSILKSILNKSVRNEKEKQILRSEIVKYIRPAVDEAKVFECVSFILGNESDLSLRLLKAYREAKRNIRKGGDLPYETLEGIRSTFHARRFTSGDVLELTRKNLTEKQKKNFQRKAEKAHVEVEFDPMKQSAVDLYIYGFERGMTHDIRIALVKKAKEAVALIPDRYGKLGIVIDTSASMFGHETRKLHPMATALAVRDMLSFLSDNSVIRTSGGNDSAPAQMIRPSGDTSLAEELVSLISDDVEAVFMITDGYENAPAGRVNEVLKILRKIGVDTPVYQVSPVFAAEADGLRVLSDEVSALPLNKPEAFGLQLLKRQLENDLMRGIDSLARFALPKLEE
jgi:hypothetical protein